MFAILLLIAAPSATDEVVVDPKSALDPVICRREKVTGSMLQTKRICMRKSEWAAQREINRQAIEKAQLQNSPTGPAG